MFSFAWSSHSDWMRYNEQNRYKGVSCCLKARKLSWQFWYWTPERFQFSLCWKVSCESDQSKIVLRNIWWSKVWDVQDETESSEWTSIYIRHHYFVCLCWNLLDSIIKTLEPANYGWIIKSGPLNSGDNFSPVLSDFTTRCHCKKICTKNCGCKRISEKWTE